MAFERPPVRSGVTGRPALAAAVVGILGVVGAVTLVRGIDDVLHRPERVGQSWDVEAAPQFDINAADPVAVAQQSIEQAGPHLDASTEIAAYSVSWRAPGVVNGKGDVPLYAMDTLKGSVEYAVLHGRSPSTDTEIALGPRTAALIHAGIGDIVTVGTDARPMKVVGITLLRQTPHTSFDEGAWITRATFDRTTVEAGRDPLLLFRLSKGTTVEQAMQSIGALGLYPMTPAQPPDVANLQNVRNLPLLLAAFVILLALGAAAHALLTGARARARELAVMRALGLTPRQAAGCVTWQAAAMGVVALTIGVPLGVIVGRQVWRVLADSLSFVYVGPLAVQVIVVTVPAALAVLGALSVWPARGAARLRTAEVLHSE